MNATDPPAWPASPYTLADPHHCPSCFTVISAPVCTVCGFVLVDPRAPRLLELGKLILATELERQQLLGLIRQSAVAPAAAAAAAPESVRAAVPEVVAAASAPLPVPEPVALVAPRIEPVSVPPAAPMPVTEPAPLPQKRSRRRLTVPVLLLIVGVSLVGIAAIFFLTLAWFVAGIAVRATIIAAITLATIATASLLRRRALTATAEGVAVLGILLLALDAWAVRANDLFGSTSLSSTLYAGVAVLGVAAACRIWAILSHLRAPDLAAVLALPVGIGLIAAGATALPPEQAALIGLFGASAGGLAHALPRPWSAAADHADAVPERTTLAIVGVAALVIGALTSFIVSPGSAAVALWAVPVIAALAAVHAFFLRPAPAPVVWAPRGLRLTAAVTGVVMVATLGWQLVLRSGTALELHLLAPVVAVAVFVAADRLWPRGGALRPAAAVAGAIAGPSIVAVASVWLVGGVQTIRAHWTLWSTDALFDPRVDGAILALVAALLIAVGLFALPSLQRPGRRDVRSGGAGAVLLLAAVHTGVPVVVVGIALLVAGAAVAGLARVRAAAGADATASDPGWGWTIAAALAAIVGFAAGTATPWLWLVGVAVALAVPIAIFVVVRPRGGAAAGVALVPMAVATLAAVMAPGAIGTVIGTFGYDGGAALALIEWVALAGLIVAAALRFEAMARTAVASSALVLLCATFGWTLVTHSGLAPLLPLGPVAAAIGEPVLAIVRAALLLAVLPLIALGRARVDSAAAVGAALLTGPAAGAIAIGALDLAGVPLEDTWRVLAIGAALLAPWAAAIASLRGWIRHDRGIGARRAADLGALATALALPYILVWQAQPAVLLAVAVGLAGTAVVRDAAAPQSAALPGVPTVRAPGAVTRAVPRRLLVWPAFAAAAAAWTRFVGHTSAGAPIEAYVALPAAALLVLAVVLVWLRRHREATVAVVLSSLLGLVLVAFDAWWGTPSRGVVVAVISAMIAIALMWTPARRVGAPAVAGAFVAVVALLVLSTQRGITGTDAAALWLGVPIVAAFLAALGARRGGPGPRPWALVRTVAPVISLAVGAIAMTALASRPLTVTVAIALLAAIHLAAAALDSSPFDAAVRWTAAGGAVLVAGAAVATGIVDEIEFVSVPLGAVVLAGVVLAMRRHGRVGASEPAGESIVWLTALGLTVAASVCGPPATSRTWLVIGICLLLAAGASVTPFPRSSRLTLPSALVLTGGALAMGVRAFLDPALAGSGAAAIIAGAGAVGIAAVLLWMRADDVDVATTSTTVIGALVAVIATLAFADGSVLQTVVIAVPATVAAVVGALLLGHRRWTAWAGVVAIAGVIMAASAIGARFLAVALPGSGVEPDLWAVAGVAVMVLVGLCALRATPARIVGTLVGIVLSAATILFSLAEGILIGANDPDQARAFLVAAGLTAVGVAGYAQRARLGWTLPATAGGALLLFGLLMLTAHGVRPVELITAPPAAGLLLLGARELRHRPQLRSWPALGPGLGLLLVPSLLHDFGESALWRVVLLGVVAIATVVVAVRMKLQAPLLIGSIVLLVHGVAQLWPMISATYIAVPWWLWLGVGGALLILIAARYEQEKRRVRKVFTAVTTLR